MSFDERIFSISEMIVFEKSRASVNSEDFSYIIHT